MDDLIERVGKLTGPDREVDGLIWVFEVPRIADLLPHWTAFDREDMVPRFTGSLDAAVALCERMLPGAEFSLTNLYGVAMAQLPLNMSDDIEPQVARRADGNLALALLTALLSALRDRSAP